MFDVEAEKRKGNFLMIFAPYMFSLKLQKIMFSVDVNSFLSHAVKTASSRNAYENTEIIG